MKNIIQFSISEGNKFYTAEGMNVPIVTQGKTFEELKKNIVEAVELYFEEEDPLALGLSVTL